MKKKIFNTLIELSNTIGTSNVSMSKLAKEMNMSKANIYNYFKDKDSLIKEAIEYKFSEMNELIFVEINKNNDPVTNLKRYIKMHVELMLKNYVFFNFIHDVIFNRIIPLDKKDDLKLTDTFVRSVIVKIYKQGIEQGLFDENINPERFSAYMFSILKCFFFENKFCRDEKDMMFKSEESDVYIEELFTIILKGVLKKEDK